MFVLIGEISDKVSWAWFWIVNGFIAGVALASALISKRAATGSLLLALCWMVAGVALSLHQIFHDELFGDELYRELGWRSLIEPLIATCLPVSVAALMCCVWRGRERELATLS